MKYIRTNSEVYDIDDLYVCEELNEKPYATKDGGWCIYKDSIIKQADTIEALCDEFVIKGTRGRYLGTPLQECELRNIPITQIYGAIWTDKGLIYVAKMNEKGELELI